MSTLQAKFTLSFFSKLILHFPCATNRRHDEIGPRIAVFKNGHIQTASGSRIQCPGRGTSCEMFPCCNAGLMFFKVTKSKHAAGSLPTGLICWYVSTWCPVKCLGRRIGEVSRANLGNDVWYRFSLKAQRNLRYRNLNSGFLSSTPLGHFWNMPSSSSSWLLSVVNGMQSPVFRVICTSPLSTHSISYQTMNVTPAIPLPSTSVFLSPPPHC